MNTLVGSALRATRSAALLLACLPALSAPVAAPVAAPAVGLTERFWSDAQRQSWREPGPRPLHTLVWYPAAAGVREQAWRLKIFEVGSAAREAPAATEPARMPLVLLSHGTSGAAATVGWLAHTLARHGYVVAAVNHHGNTMAEGDETLKGFMLWWERARDVQLVLDRLLADPRLGSRIDPRRIGIAGFSVGGYTALAAAGVRLNVAGWGDYCTGRADDPICHLPPEADFKMSQVHEALAHAPDVRASVAKGGDAYGDPRLRAALAIAPVLGPLYTPQSMARVTIPVRIVVGAADDQSLPDLNARPAAAAIPGAELQILPQVTHYTFLPNCTVIGRVFASQFCVDPAGIDRQAVQARVAADAVRFFDRTLGPAP